MSTLVEQLGGPPAISAAVDELYRRIFDDDLLVPYFADIDMPRLKSHMIDFLNAALGADNARYQGRDMHAAHAELGVTDEAFDHVAGHLVGTLTGLGVPAPLVDEVVGHIAPLREQIVTAG